MLDVYNLPYPLQCDIDDMEYAWELLQRGVFYQPFFGIYSNLKADIDDYEETYEETYEEKTEETPKENLLEKFTVYLWRLRII